MDNDFFLNAGIPPTWHQSLSSSPMSIQPSLLNSSSSSPPQDSFYNNNTSTWEKSTDHHHALQFDSALSSLVSSPSASNSNSILPTNDNFAIRELIGKLGNIGAPSSSSSYINGNNHNNNNSTNTSCYSTPLSSPPKINMIVNSSVAEFSTDPGFAERAAKFSCFGSRSFNGRTNQLGLNNNSNNNGQLSLRSTNPPLMENGKLARVSSSPSLKALAGSQPQSQIGVQENKNSPLMDNSQEESTISEQTLNAENAGNTNSRKRKASSKGKAKEASTSANPNPKDNEGNEDSNAKRSKTNEGEGNNENGTVKAEEESKDEKQNKSNSSKPPEPPKDYIHVRARRGQATDSHSLAERVRREKISERMKLLQDLVPGCNKVTGKALMLDEIINYVQSLQRQVEFLSMKLASVNTRLDFNMDSLISKDIFQSNNTMAHSIFPLDSSAQAFYGHQQNPAIPSNILNGTMTHTTVDPLETASLCQNLGMQMQLPPLNGFSEAASQFPVTFCEEDLHTIVQMGFGQTASGKSPTHSQNFNGSNQISHMKVEL